MRDAAIDVVTHRRWWCLFGDGSNLGWVEPFTQPGWQHCMAVTELTPGFALVVDPTRQVLDYQIPITNVHETLKHYVIEEEMRCVVVNVDKPDYDLAKHWCINSCATVVAHTLGLDTWAVTPKQRWRALLNRDGKDITSEIRGDY